MPITESLYLRIANQIEQHIKTGVLKAGDKLPSLRTICHEQDVSMNTALQSYYELEKRALIESKPQSGYYVSYTYRHFPEQPQSSKPLKSFGEEEIEKIIDTVSENKEKVKVRFTLGCPEMELLPIAKLNKAMIHAMRTMPGSGVFYNHSGNDNLKRQIAQRSIHWGGTLVEEDIIPTAGCSEALAFSMISVAKRGDTIAVESPVFHGILQLARNLGLNVLELPTNPKTGIEIDALHKALKNKKINLCILIPNFSNPLGSCMPDEHKKEVVRLMEHYNVPLIEDDLYGDLYFGPQRPKTCKTFDESGIVLHCSSFSKTLASGYRVGWVAPGKFKEKVNRTRRYHSISSNVLAHEAIAYFLENDRYDNHLRKLRQTLRANMLQFLRCISEYFPLGTRVTKPDGGFILWVELDKKADTLKLYDKALAHYIDISPGPMYTLQKQYQNCFRLNCGLKWTPEVENALKLLGRLAGEV